ncbi:MAG TPA: cytochrome C oxidase subunit IV family protein [Kofleriaceae bacterium]|jgi:cytochrome c oxidase subunit 4
MATALPDPIVESESHDSGASGEPGALTYVLVWVALVVLATVTLFASRAVTGGWGLVVALAIATSKAVLVVAYFMHLAMGRPIYRIVFTIAMAFFVLLVIGVLADVATRSIASSYVDELGRPL